jgi:hypothetical protein
MWLFGLVFSIIGVIVEIYETAIEESKLRALKKEGSLDSKGEASLAAIKNKKTSNFLNLIKNLGDTITASSAIGLPKQLFGFEFNDGHIGFGGLTSSLITCYQLFPAAPPK